LQDTARGRIVGEVTRGHCTPTPASVSPIQRRRHRFRGEAPTPEGAPQPVTDLRRQGAAAPRPAGRAVIETDEADRPEGAMFDQEVAGAGRAPGQETLSVVQGVRE